MVEDKCRFSAMCSSVRSGDSGKYSHQERVSSTELVGGRGFGNIKRRGFGLAGKSNQNLRYGREQC